MDLFSDLERKNGLPSGILDAVWSAESGRGQNMVSPKGAKGHFQFMPATAAQYGVTNPNDLQQAATGAARMLSDMMQQTGSVPGALAAYNWGIGNVQRKGIDAAPAETRNYIQKVTSNMSNNDPFAQLNAEYAEAHVPQQKKDPFAELNNEFSNQYQSDPADQSQQQNVVAAPAAQGDESLLHMAARKYLDYGAAAQEARKNFFAGALRGAGSIGATLLAPYDMAKDALAGKGLSLESNRERRAGMDGGLRELGANPDSGFYSGGKLGGEIAGTAGAGPLIAGGAKGIPIVNTAAAPLISSIESGGLAVNGASGLSGLALRGLGGAITGGVSAGLVNPEDAGFGAAVGAALPVGVKALGTIGQAIGSQLKPTGEKADLARKAIDMGAPIGIADIADGKFTKATRSILNDSWLTGSIGSAQNEAKQRWLNRAVGEVFDAAGDKLTPQVMDAAKQKMGSEFDRIWGNNNLIADNDFASALDRIKSNADMLPQGEGKRVMGMIDDLQSKIQTSQDGTSFIPGDVANRFQSSIRRTAESAQGFLKNDLASLRQEVISAFNRSVSPEDAAALALNQSKYKAYKTVEPLLEKGALGVAGREAGDVPAALLPNAVFNSYKGNAANSPLADLSKIGSTFMVDRTLQTGGSQRAAIQNTAIGAGLLGLGTINPWAAAAVVPSAMLTNKALGSPAMAKGLLKVRPPQLGGLLTFGQKAAPILVTE